ncbi:hypothetical protein OIE71_01770 [Streptomyces sp. NBC_01725]|uniref:hypothetical protein n=1 Tax=Streptomyces sp. NBC_01725 TaxID=2975923 RepID=UPI002E28D613|nr:hypothetical protein [Streptomyces sp. NBC_01725]
MGLLPTVLISLVFPVLMLFVMVALGRMEEILLPHLRAPRPAEEEKDAPSENSPAEDSRKADANPATDADVPAEDLHAEEIRIAHARADLAKARAEALRRSARRRAYGTPRAAGRGNTGPPRGARTTPLRFR